MNSSVYTSVPVALDDVRHGRMIIITDANTREDEGDLFLPAQNISAEKVNFMITHGKGLLCVPVTSAKAEKLQLPLMVPAAQNEESTKCNFTLPVDARHGIRSGISASDRARTIQLLEADDTQVNDLVKPGHIFPLIAKNGGLRERAGHTEAAIELCRMAEKTPTGVICEIIGHDGEMLRGEALADFAAEHQLKIISIEQILEYLNESK